MKKIFILPLICLGAFLVANVFASKPEEDETAKVKRFYEQYAASWCIKNIKESFRVGDSVMAIYCNKELCDDTKNDRNGGIYYDFATDDTGMDSLSLKTLQVVKVNDYYKVTYKKECYNDRCKKEIRDFELKVELKNGKINKVTKTK